MPMRVFSTDELYSLDEATKLLGIGIATLFRWMKTDKIIPLRLNGRTYIPKSEVERLNNA